MATNNQRRRSDKDSFSISEQVPANSSSEQVVEVPSDATIERLQVRIYTGAELDLNITPVVRTSTGQERPIVKLRGKSVIDGDDDFYEFAPTKPIQDNDKLVVKATNTGTNALDYRVNIDVDYRNGLVSFVGGLLDGVV
jgi:hypothetical protein